MAIQLTKRYYSMVAGQALRVQRQTETQPDPDDIVAVGSLALYEAANLYSRDMRMSFTVYAKKWIRAAMLDWIEQQYSAFGSLVVRSPLQRAIEEAVSPRATDFKADLANLSIALRQTAGVRKERRKVVKQRAVVTIHESVHTTTEGYLLDVSSSGMKLSLPDRIPVGTLISVKWDYFTVRARVGYCLCHKGATREEWHIGAQILHQPSEPNERMSCANTASLVGSHDHDRRRRN